LVEPLGEFVQLTLETDHVSCSTKPGVLGVHEIVAKPGAAAVMVSVGAPSTCTA
jgi:hypothetical protein